MFSPNFCHMYTMRVMNARVKHGYGFTSLMQNCTPIVIYISSVTCWTRNMTAMNTMILAQVLSNLF